MFFMRWLPVLLLVSSLWAADGPAWVPLTSDDLAPADVFTGGATWTTVGDAALDEKEPRKLIGKPGKGVLLNKKDSRDLVTKAEFGDVEIELEFMMSKRSNSGVKFHAVYEIQICDSFGEKGTLTGDDCGGVYPRANLLPVYKHIDKGIAPKVNACKEPGTWQKLHAIFVGPRFDADGKKTANARIVKATLNGMTIHEDVELKTPTGHNWDKKEKEKGPILLQGDHGPVAFRNV